MHVTHMRACHTAGSRVVPRNIKLRPYDGTELSLCVQAVQPQTEAAPGSGRVCSLRNERPSHHLTKKSHRKEYTP